RRPDDVDFVLPHADRLDQNHILARSIQHERGVPGRPRQAAEVPARRHAPNEYGLVLGMRLHSQAVAEHRPSGERARRVDGDHADSLTVAAELRGQAVYERALPRARWTGDA